MRYISCCIVAVLVVSAACGQSPQPAAEAKNWKQSVGRLAYFDGQGGCATGTGFVINGLFNSDKSVVTAAHIATRAIDKGSFFLWLYGAPKKIRCKPVAWNRKYDLLVLQPDEKVDVPGLELSPSEPCLQSEVLVLGAACGLDISQHSGVIHADRTQASEMMDSLRRAIDVNSPLAPQTLVIRHNAASCKGFSGAPLLDGSGRVLGVQHGGIAGTDENFAVAISHLSELRAMEVDTDPPLHSAGIEQHVAFKPVPANSKGGLKIDFGNGLVDVDFSLAEGIGLAPRFATAAFFDRTASESRWVPLALCLRNRKYNAVTSDAFGIRVFAPPQYKVHIDELERPGCMLRFSEQQHDSDRPVYLPISVFAFGLEDSYGLRADRAYLNEIVASDQILFALAELDINRRLQNRRRFCAAYVAELLLEEALSRRDSKHRQIHRLLAQDKLPAPDGVAGVAAIYQRGDGTKIEIRSVTAGRTGVVTVREFADGASVDGNELDARLIQALVALE